MSEPVKRYTGPWSLASDGGFVSYRDWERSLEIIQELRATIDKLEAEIAQKKECISAMAETCAKDKKEIEELRRQIAPKPDPNYQSGGLWSGGPGMPYGT